MTCQAQINIKCNDKSGSKQEVECRRCGRPSVAALGYKGFLSSGQEKKAKL